MKAYHYSKNRFKKFNKAMIGNNVDNGYFGKGFYFWDDRNEAENYCSQFGVYIYDVELSIKAFIIDLDNDLIEIVKSIGFNKNKEAEYIDIIENYGEIETSEWFEDSGIEKILADRGFSAVIIKNRRNISCDEICVFDAGCIEIINVEKIK